MPDQITEYILKRKSELNAVIMAHFYQRPEIQEIADFVGDSLQLAQKAAETQAGAIFFCGVSFMAESAKILNPDKLVVLPEPEAGCPMADMITGEQLRNWKAKHPGATVVTYVNSSAEVKAESDVCCTSSNAIAVVRSIPEDTPILFVPDQNLGAFVADKTGRKNITCWPGFCPTHHHFKPEDIQEIKTAHPDAVVIVHPECRPEIIALADEALSTGGMLKYVEKSSAEEFVIGTEEGLMYQLRKRFPAKTFYLAHEKLICPNMKLTTIEKLAYVMETMEPSVEVPEDIRLKAYKALERMLKIN
ncbi:MAG: quinolinate synthase NadA [Ignavibacteriales bacterium]